MIWTDERVANLKVWWLEGKSASECARLLAPDCTRNMVISKVHRLKKSDKSFERHAAPDPCAHAKNRSHTLRRLSAARTRSRPPPKPVKAAALTFGLHHSPVPVAPTFVPERDEVGLVSVRDADRHHCRWPIGDPQTDSFRLCGRDKAEVGSYCEAHRAIGVRATITAAEMIRSVRRVA